MLDQRSLTDDESDYDWQSEAARPKISKNNFSLNFTIEASIQLLEQLAEDKSKPELAQSRNLLYFLGCLPGGVMIDKLKLMWENVEESKKVLDDLSLLE